MPDYKIQKDRLIKVWERATFYITADSQAEALQQAKDQDEEGGADDYETLHDSEIFILPEDNDGFDTEQWLIEDDRIEGNGKEPESMKRYTPVIFLIEKDGEDVFAYLPGENYSEDGSLKICYAHIGQHSSCDPDYAKECELAKPEQYNDLLQELIGQGYNNLKILNAE